ncbi:MAG: hypothetical protein ACRCXX_10535, partial [Cetobacterium sp.]|uniref:hypothetical protein n=2 Tax=Cetobacterium sp. TaxID=2071632 RepID=UPI003F415729
SGREYDPDAFDLGDYLADDDIIVGSLAEDDDQVRTNIGVFNASEIAAMFGGNNESFYDRYANTVNTEDNVVMPTTMTLVQKRKKLINALNVEQDVREDDYEILEADAKTGKKRRARGSKSAFEEFLGEDEDTSKKKKDLSAEDIFTEKFAPRVDELNALDGDVSDFTEMIVSNVKELYASKAKGSFKLISESASTVSSLFSTKLSIIDKKTAITKTIADLSMKAEKAGGGASQDANFVIDQLMNKLIAGGVGPTSSADLDRAVNMLDINESSRYQNNVSTAMSVIDNLEGTGDIEFTEAELALKYAHLNVSVYVEAYPHDRTWNFVALTDSDEPLYDYPLPSTSLAKMDIDWEYGQYAKDKNSGISYPLILRGY